MTIFNQNVIRHKVGLLNLAAELGNVSRDCKVMGLSRDTFYRYQEAMKTGGVEVPTGLNDLSGILTRAVLWVGDRGNFAISQMFF